MAGTSMWTTLDEALSRPEEGNLGLWSRLKERLELGFYRPQAAEGIVASHLASREGEYYVLKNPATKTYYRLSDRDYFFWERMDGSRTVKDLVVAYFLEYHTFAFARVAGLVQGLRASLMLSERPIDVYQKIRGRLAQRDRGYRLNQVWHAFLQKQFAITGLDDTLTAIYRRGGRLLFTRAAQILFLIVAITGLYAFARNVSEGQYGVVTIAGSLALGIAGLIVANLLSILVHEMAHALTVKHYGREVRRGGFMLYFGTPAFFVDTTDIWMEGKRARLAVTWAGPYSGLILGGLASIAIWLWPEGGLNALLFQFAFLSYLTVFFNLNPLLELDGYYLLMDSLEIPMLRRRSLAFIRGGLWEKFKALPALEAPGRLRAALASFSREEKIFAVFGLLSAAWTAYAIYMGAYFWQQRLAGALRDLWAGEGGPGKILLALIMAALSLVFVLSIGLALLGMARKAFGWAVRRGVFANPWNVAALLAVLAAGLALAPALLGYPTLRPVIGLLALAIAAYFAWRNALTYAGSRFSRVFWLLGLFALALLLRLALSSATEWRFLPPAGASQGPMGTLSLLLSYLAYTMLALAGLLLFADTNLKELSLAEKLLLVLGLAASYGLVLWQSVGLQAAGLPGTETLGSLAASLAPLLALTLLVPTLFAFWRTGFGPGWTMLAVSLGALVVAASLPPGGDGLHWQALLQVLAYLLLGGGLLLQTLGYRSAAFLREQPETAFGLTDAHRLRRAHSWTVLALLAQLRQIAGERSAHIVVERWNNYALAAGWRVQIARDEVEDGLPDGMSLAERGEVYAAALSLLLDLLAQEVGEKPTVRTLQRAYDGLPWEEREIGAQYLFREVERAEVLSREFQATSQDYRGLLQRMPIFATMDAAEIDLLAGRLRAEHHAPGQAIIRQGDAGDRFYIIRRGHVEVTMQDERGVLEVVDHLDRGDYFGELALLHDAASPAVGRGRRNATCRATVPTETLSLDREDFQRLVKTRFDLGEKVDRSIARAQLLRRIPLFSEMDAGQIQLIAAQLQEERYEAGEILIRQGETGETFYVIESGRVQVSVAPDGSQPGVEKVVAERGLGEYVGEIALLLQVPRTATVRALQPTQALVLHKDDFEQLVAQHLYVSRGLERETSRRMLNLQRATQ